jgi:hypothetical protein
MMTHWKTRLPFLAAWPKTVFLEGISVPIRESPFPSRLRRHLMNGGYETAERRLVQEFVSEGDQVLELGASAGVVTSFLWRQVGRSGRVVSVEGNSRLKPWFEAQQAINGFLGEWIETLCYPTWEARIPPEIDQVGFSLSSNPLGSAADRGSDGHGGVGSKPGWQTARQICDATGLEPTVLVADIEGSEGVWAEISPGIPSSVSKAIVEFHPDLIGSVRTGQCIQALINEGFVITGMAETVLAFERSSSPSLG